MKNIRRKRVPPYTNKLFPMLILLSVIFMGVGYASINSIIMNINGEVIAKAQDGIYITEVNYVSDVDADLVNSKMNATYQTILDTTVVLSDSNINSNMMFEVTIYNGTDNIYLFDGVTYDLLAYSNEDITYEIIDFPIGEMIIPGEFKTLKLNFKYVKENFVENSGKNILNSKLKFNFILEHFRWDSYEVNGFDVIEILSSSSSNLKMKISPMSGPYDRFIIPIDNLEVGSYYKVTFTENKVLTSGTTYENASKKYTYGTTITTKEIDSAIGKNEETFVLPKYFNYSNSPKHTAFMWKEPFLELNYIEGKTYDISLTFYASESTMYWMWDFSNINNDCEIEFNLLNIVLTKIEVPTSEPYIRFMDTVFNEWRYDTDYNDDGEDEEQNYLKYTYRTNATTNELDLRIETGIGWEYFNIPIENLTIGSKYKITYEVDTTPTALTINTTNIYGSTITSSKYTDSSQIISSSNSTSSSVSIVNKIGNYSGSLEFTASASTMYWVWQCGGINNYQWANIKISNATIQEIS